ncbi:hypothetical protein PoB_000686700 [Plakobranchus ocellatus]|uniref:Uncharacterized protein n=1 Tax=Plakobranchus ocellatus TaxID=259542 RepID=A0AAV3YE08_9GAST|nr:hypothetical protein PoB_000686700 [Plakobranchus ocellatus]
MKEEVETAISIKKMKHGKATGPDNISVELILEALEDFGIGKVTHLLNEIYDTGQIPTDLSKSIFIALPKKPESQKMFCVDASVGEDFKAAGLSKQSIQVLDVTSDLLIWHQSQSRK